ncbi:unnamed protein product [Mortierella alpina]
MGDYECPVSYLETLGGEPAKHGWWRIFRRAFSGRLQHRDKVFEIPAEKQPVSSIVLKVNTATNSNQ